MLLREGMPSEEENTSGGERQVLQSSWQASAGVPDVRHVSITGGGKRPPRLETPGVKVSTVCRYLRDYRCCTDELEVLNCDGRSMVAASMQKLGTPYIQRMIATKFCRGTPMTETLAHDGLVEFMDDQDTLDGRVFAKAMLNLLRMNGRLSVENRVFEGKLYHYMDANILSDAVMPDGVWAVGPGSILVTALLAGLRPPEYKKDVMQTVKICTISVTPPLCWKYGLNWVENRAW